MAAATTQFDLQLALVIGFAVILGLVVLVPWTLDLVFTHNERLERIKKSETLPSTEGQEREGTRGLSRASMAMAVIVVIGFALLYLLVMNPFPDAAKTATTIVVALTTTLAAISAFYFGTKVAQETAEQTTKTKEIESKPKVVLKPAANGQVAAKEHLHVEYDEVLNSH